jgi:hypothetical protein
MSLILLTLKYSFDREYFRTCSLEDVSQKMTKYDDVEFSGSEGRYSPRYSKP